MKPGSFCDNNNWVFYEFVIPGHCLLPKYQKLVLVPRNTLRIILGNDTRAGTRLCYFCTHSTQVTI